MSDGLGSISMIFGSRGFKGFPDIRTFFRTNEQPVFFLGPTAFNLPGIDHWVRNTEYVVVIGLEQGRISRSWQPDATTSRWRPWPNPGFRMFRVVQHEREETGMHLRYLWARHPAIAGGNVHHVRAVSSRVTPSPSSRCRAARSPVATTFLTTAPRTQKPSPHWERALTCGN